MALAVLVQSWDTLFWLAWATGRLEWAMKDFNCLRPCSSPSKHARHCNPSMQDQKTLICWRNQGSFTRLAIWHSSILISYSTYLFLIFLLLILFERKKYCRTCTTTCWPRSSLPGGARRSSDSRAVDTPGPTDFIFSKNMASRTKVHVDQWEHLVGLDPDLPMPRSSPSSIWVIPKSLKTRLEPGCLFMFPNKKSVSYCSRIYQIDCGVTGQKFWRLKRKPTICSCSTTWQPSPEICLPKRKSRHNDNSVKILARSC